MKNTLIIALGIALGATGQYRHDLCTVRSILRSTAGSITENVEQANALLDLSESTQGQFEHGYDWRQYPDQ